MTQREVLRKKIHLTTIFGIIIILIAYGIFQARNLALGPVVSVISPVNGETVQSPLVKIAGTAKNVSFLTLNGLHIFTDQNGNWSEDRILSLGYNILTIYAKDKFGKETTKTLELTYNI